MGRGSKNQSPNKRGETDKLDRFLCAEGRVMKYGNKHHYTT